MINKVPHNVAKMYSGGMSISEVNEVTDIPLSTIRFRLKKLGILRSRADGVRNSEKRGRNPHNGSTTPKSDEAKKKMSLSKLKKWEENAIGFSYKPNGYMEFTRGPFKGRQVHTVLAERTLERKLVKGEVVHHKDLNRYNNSPLNLQVMTRSEHATLHAKLNISSRRRDEKGRLI